jgi:hypothetical protein
MITHEVCLAAVIKNINVLFLCSKSFQKWYERNQKLNLYFL